MLEQICKIIGVDGEEAEENEEISSLLQDCQFYLQKHLGHEEYETYPPEELACLVLDLAGVEYEYDDPYDTFSDYGEVMELCQDCYHYEEMVKACSELCKRLYEL